MGLNALHRSPAMLYRPLGKTGLEVSEIGFGAWGLGGTAYGPVDRQQALGALACAEELGCNFVDTAATYGNSEDILGEFLQGRRDRWIVATKYSRQSPSMTATVEAQLRRLKTDVIDVYQMHWSPLAAEHHYYDELETLKRAGKVRYVGVSLYSAGNIDYVLEHTAIDTIQVCFSLLDPGPFLPRSDELARSGRGVIVRSALKEGFLTGKFSGDVTFTAPGDQRTGFDRERIAQLLEQVEALRFLEQPCGSMTRAAVAYPLSFPQVSTVIVGAKTVAQARANFGELSGARLDGRLLARIAQWQDRVDLLGRRTVKGRLRRLLGRD